jgi:hypothetical protein
LISPQRNESGTDVLAGHRIGRYLLFERLGQGGMGEVYLAIDTILRHRVGLKLPHHWIQADAAVRRRLLKEARAAAAIDHPYVHKIFDVSEIADGAFSVTVSKVVEVETEQQAWSEVFECEVKDVISVQSEVAERIAARLVTNLAAAHRQELSCSGTKDPQACKLQRELGPVPGKGYRGPANRSPSIPGRSQPGRVASVRHSSLAGHRSARKNSGTRSWQPQAQNLIAVGLLGLGKHDQAVDLLETSAWL